jgi:hypothetical protein
MRAPLATTLLRVTFSSRALLAVVFASVCVGSCAGVTESPLPPPIADVQAADGDGEGGADGEGGSPTATAADPTVDAHATADQAAAVQAADAPIPDEAGGAGEAETPTGDAAGTEAAQQAAAEAEAVAADQAATFFPATKHTARMVGVHRLLGGTHRFLLVTQHSAPLPNASDGEARFSITRESRDGESLGALGDPRTEQLVAIVSDESVRLGLAPSPVRRVPEPVVVLPRPPAIGATWTVTGGGAVSTCRVVSRGAASGFASELPGCLEVEIRDDDGARTTRHWYDRERGVVRTEVRDAAGALVLGLTLVEGDLPSDDDVLGMFPARRLSE